MKLNLVLDAFLKPSDYCRPAVSRRIQQMHEISQRTLTFTLWY